MSEIDNEIADFVRSELNDGITFEELLEAYDLTPENVFVHLFNTGMIDEEVLKEHLLDFE
jgi:hypothetical protein